ncbi:MAG: ImmA/IrrE family metallo-endopeptidase [Alphaproteobacteria bacterium]|nr:ImmA/IrrE family metallo-endopeptidase [Alphaproteobacteria bacterium]
MKKSLRAAGFSQSAIEAAWPDWWSNDADASTSARAELRFSLSRKLGLDPRSLLEDDLPKFVWTDKTKYKRLSAESRFEQEAMASFGTGVGRILVEGAGQQAEIRPTAAELRAAVLREKEFVHLPDVLGVCWSFGIPVGYLRVFPLTAKRMAAMAVNINDHYCILLSQNARYPAPVSYYIAHELGHILLGHLEGQRALVDVGDPLTKDNDPEEIAADRFALEFLTGQPEPTVTTDAKSFLSRQLADVAIRSAGKLGIEPGLLAMCFGHSTGRWDKAYGALKYIYSEAQPMWEPVNNVLVDQLDWSAISPDMTAYVQGVLGIVHDARSLS